jgi:hypothetical protein
MSDQEIGRAVGTDKQAAAAVLPLCVFADSNPANFIRLAAFDH